MHLKSQLEAPFDNFEDNYGDLTGTIGLSYKPNVWLNLIARYAKGFRAPNFNDTIVTKLYEDLIELNNTMSHKSNIKTQR